MIFTETTRQRKQYLTPRVSVLNLKFQGILSYLNGNLSSREPGFFCGKRSTEGGWNWETWKTLKNTISDKKLRLWDALYEALKKYYHTLTARSG